MDSKKARPVTHLDDADFFNTDDPLPVNSNPSRPGGYFQNLITPKKITSKINKQRKRSHDEALNDAARHKKPTTRPVIQQATQKDDYLLTNDLQLVSNNFPTSKYSSHDVSSSKKSIAGKTLRKNHHSNFKDAERG